LYDWSVGVKGRAFRPQDRYSLVQWGMAIKPGAMACLFVGLPIPDQSDLDFLSPDFLSPRLLWEGKPS